VEAAHLQVGTPDKLSVKCMLSTPSMTGSVARDPINRSQFLLIQTVVTIALSYQLLFSRNTVLTFTSQELIILGLALLLGAVVIFPARFWGDGRFIGTVMLTDTVLASGIVYLSGNSYSELYLTYFLIILIAAFAPTMKLHLTLSVILCLSYGVILYARTGSLALLKEGDFLQIPLLIIMAIFYGNMVRSRHLERENLLETIEVLRRTQESLRRSEEQLRQSQKMEAIGRLAGGIAHDFNNLLMVITGYTQLLLNDSSIGDMVRKNLEEIRKAGERATTLTFQLLAFSRRQILQPKVLDLNAVVTNLAPMLRRLIGEDVEFLTVVKSGLGHVKADPSQIEQVIMNLVINARDAMPKGGVLTIETANVELDEVYCAQHFTPQTGPYVLLAVSDTGCGMDAQTQSHIFEPFFTTKKQGKGTGLGLSTVYGIVKQSGGSLFVYSEPGQGTTFKVYLPQVKAKVESFEPLVPAQFLPRGTETILLVEDESGVRNLIHAILQANGYTLLVASNGHEAVRISRQHDGPIHLLITDVVMPGMSGRELAEQLRHTRPHMKLLCLSGYTEDALLQHGISSEEFAFLQKPFTPASIAYKVREILDAAISRLQPA
jgi:signal transduction histidine kinase/ActR/RegA family two-component response regulator